MKAKVLKNFKDKHRNRYYKKGDIFEHSEEKRIKELEKLGYIKRIAEEKKTAAKKTATKTTKETESTDKSSDK